MRNDVQARQAWPGMMKECTVFYQEHMPFDVVCDPAPRQEGNTDYVNAAADFVFDTALHPAESVFEVLNDTGGALRFNSGDAQIPMPATDRRTVGFRKAGIRNPSGSGAITLKILKVNGIDVNTFALTGYMRVLTRAGHAAPPENRRRR